MTSTPKSRNVVEFRPKASELRRTVVSLATNTTNVSWSDHALDQMAARDIFDTDVLKVLRTGEIEGEIVPGRSQGEWKCKMVARIKGNRDVGVVTVVCNGNRLFLKTVEWEDLR